MLSFCEYKIHKCAKNKELKALSNWLYLYSIDLIAQPGFHLSTVYAYGARCLAENGYVSETYEFFRMHFHKVHPSMRFVLLTGMAEGFASSGLKEEAYKILDEVKSSPLVTRHILESMIQGFVISSRRAEAYELFEHVEKKCPDHLPYVIRQIVSTEERTKKAITPETKAFLVEKLSTTTDQDILNNIVKTSKPLGMSRLIRQVDKRRQGMVERGISYHQIEWWINPVIRMLLLQGFGVNKINNEFKEWRLPFDMVYHILGFLLPMQQKEIGDFTEKFYRQMSKLGKGRFTLSYPQDESKAFFTPSLKNTSKTTGELEEQQSELPHKGVVDILLDAPKPQTTGSPALKKGFFKEIVDFTEKYYRQMSKLGKERFFPSHSQDESKASFTPSVKNALKAKGGFEEQQSELPHNGVIDILLEAPEPQTTESLALQKAFFVEEQSALQEWNASSAGKKQQIPSQKTVTNTDHQVVVDVLLAASEPEKNEPVAFKRTK